MTKQVQRRRGTATQHTSFTGAEGEVSVNTTNKSVHVHDGVTAGGIEGARADLTNVSDSDLNARLTGNTLSSLTITSADINGGTIDGTVIGGTTPAAGNFTTGSFTGNVSFGDNDAAVFGAGSDLKIYHTGDHSYIDEAGTGNLYLNSNGSGTIIVGGGATQAQFFTGGAVNLYHNNAQKLATTATGIDVTGTVTADGLTVDGAANIDGASGIPLTLDVDAGSNTNLQFNENGALRWYLRNVTVSNDFNFYGNGANRLNISSGGDISFYEDTGTTPKFFWDASAESLGIGTSSPSYKLHVVGSTGFTSTDAFNQFNFAANGTGTYTNLRITNSSSTAALSVGVGGSAVGAGSLQNNAYVWNTAASSLSFGTSDRERMRIDSSGNVGIGVTPNATGGGYKALQLGLMTNWAFPTTGSAYRSHNLYYDGSNRKYVTTGTAHEYEQSSAGHVFSTAASGTAGTNVTLSEAMRIDSSGNLLVGKTASGYTTDGFEALAAGAIQVSDTSTNPVGVNRNGTDGSLISFFKSGSTVGSIGTLNDDLIVGETAACLRFDGENEIIAPSSSTAVSDARIRLGSASQRFTDLYLSGGVYLGGTGAANKLDDYEEGTWTPTIRGSGTEGSYTATTLGSSRYTKVGDLVTVSAALANITEVTAGTGYMQITNLPFTKPSATYGSGTVGISYANLGYTPSSMNIEFISTSGATNVMYVYVHRDNANSANFDISDLVDGVTDIRFTVTYRAT